MTPATSCSPMCDVFDAQKKRIAELEAALRNLIAWEGPIELCAPELGGALKAFYEARAVLERK